MAHGIGFGFGGRGRGGFGPRGGGCGQRFGFGHHPFQPHGHHPFHPHGHHPFHPHGHHPFHPHAFPQGPHHEAPFVDTPDFEDTEKCMLETVKEISRQEYDQDQECHRGHCKKDKKGKQHHFFHHNDSVEPVGGFGTHGDGFGPRFGFGHHPFHPHAFPHEHMQHHFHHQKHVHKNCVDPVWTIVENKDGKFTICIALGKEAKPEDVKLNVRERDIYIEIKMEKRSEDGTSHLSQVFTKKVALPEEVKVEDIKSNLTPEGVLKITASVPVQEEISIPVSVNTEPTAPLAEN